MRASIADAGVINTPLDLLREKEDEDAPEISVHADNTVVNSRGRKIFRHDRAHKFGENPAENRKPIARISFEFQQQREREQNVSQLSVSSASIELHESRIHFRRTSAN